MRRVLENVPQLRFWGEGAVGWFCLAGAFTRYAEYTGDPVTYPEVMAASGAAWRLVWNPGAWSPDNLIMAWYGHLLAESRIAAAFGYDYAFLDRRREAPLSAANSKAAISAHIRAEIDAGRPVLAIGIAGPEECLVAGYRENADVLLVRSFFEPSDDGVRDGRLIEVRDWYENEWFLGLHLFTKARERRPRRENLIEALQNAVRIAKQTHSSGRVVGLAAYNAWADDMLRDDDFLPDDPEAINRIKPAISDNGIVLLDARKAAGDYLLMVQDEVGAEAHEHLQAAAARHHKESELMSGAHGTFLWGPLDDAELLRRASRESRSHIADTLRTCRSHFAEAIDEICAALQAEGVAVDG